MKRRQHTANQKRRGTALVEMALVLPIFMMVTLGIVEFGRAMMVSQLITNAAREGARLGIITGSTNADVQASVESFLLQAANISASDLSLDITVTPDTGNPNPGNQVVYAHSRDLVSVSVSVPFDKVSYISGNYLKGKTLVGRSAMRHE
jgi:Flp pilus assembly protein TadG